MASRTRMLCEGAMMCALTALLLLINRVAGGMIETAFPWLLVFPLLVYCARHGRPRRAHLLCEHPAAFADALHLYHAVLCVFRFASRAGLWQRGAKGRRKPQPAAAHRAHQLSFQP